MRRRPSAAALAILLVTAGIAGVVSADQSSTDTGTTPAAATTDVPGADQGFAARLAERLRQFDLTDEQRRAIVTEAARLREAGASPLVVRSSIVLHLYEYGVDAPFLYARDARDRSGGHDRFHRVIASLDVTPMQARSLHAMAHRLHDAGASREEIRRAIRRQVAAWNEDDHEAPDGVDRFVDRVADRYDLTADRAAAVERLVRRMLDDGKHRGEIRAAVMRLVRRFDVESTARGTAAVRPEARAR